MQHFLTKTAGRLHSKGSHAKKFSMKDYRIEKLFYDKHVPQFGTLRYLRLFTFDNYL